MKPNVYRTCAVPLCYNTSIKTPDKLFIHVPTKREMRKTWLSLARRNPKTISPNSAIHFCEDHFDLPNDMENYIRYLVMGYISQIRMKPGCVPTKFECQSDGNKRPFIRPSILKKLKKTLQECEQYLPAFSSSWNSVYEIGEISSGMSSLLQDIPGKTVRWLRLLQTRWRNHHILPRFLQSSTVMQV